MRFLVFSDSHGHVNNLKKALDIHKEAEGIIFLGDGIKDILPFVNKYSQPFYFVKGNNDYLSNNKILDFIQLDKHKIMLAHGHTYNVKRDFDDIKRTARHEEADILLFGHTHIPFIQYDEGLYIMNPGSISLPQYAFPTYGILDITNTGVVTIIAKAIFPK